MRISTGRPIREMPFTMKVSFAKVFEQWERQKEEGNEIERERADKVLKALEKVEDISHPFSDLGFLDKYEKEIALLLSNLFCEALQSNEIRSITLGFDQVFFNPTRRLRDIINRAGDEFVFGLRGMTDDDFYIMGCSFMLQQLYGVQVNMAIPQLIDIPDRAAGIVRTYRSFFNADFSELKRTENSPELSQDQIQVLLDNAGNIDLWKEHIPPGSYEMHGFGIVTMFDVSVDDAISQLKNQLILKDVLLNNDYLHILRNNLARLLQIEDLKMGFAAWAEGEFHSIKNDGFCGLLMADHVAAPSENLFCDRSAKMLFTDNQSVSFSDIHSMTHVSSPLLDQLRKTSVRSYFIQPLNYNGKNIGYLELGSDKPFVLHSGVKNKLEPLVPLFASAMKRSIDEYYSKIDAVIKEKCTALHPSVEWRFVQAATRYIKNPGSEMEEIIFKNVIPLYGQMDIRGSSRHRSDSIREDLRTQLKLIRIILMDAKKKVNMLAYDQLLHRIDGFLYNLEENMDAGEEAAILKFVKEQIDPVLDFLDRNGHTMPSLFKYRKLVDKNLHVVYDKRKDYEQTVGLINDHMAGWLQNAQEEAQAIFPHYFERYKTDGVEYNMYIGRSISGRQEYHDLYLQNLRLWQLTTTCDIELLIHRLKPKMKIPLEIASLILVQDHPLDIKFRADEKQFDVDGAYNARYEIIKKRIDKAKIKDTGERITQAGKLVIVYSTAQEKSMYEEFMDFLISRSYVLPGVQNLELEGMDGATGLKALRAEINFERTLNTDIQTKKENIPALM